MNFTLLIFMLVFIFSCNNERKKKCFEFEQGIIKTIDFCTYPIPLTDSIFFGGNYDTILMLYDENNKYFSSFIRKSKSGTSFAYYFDSTEKLMQYKCYAADGDSYGGVNFRVSPPDTSKYRLYPILRKRNQTKIINGNKTISIPKGKNRIVVHSLFQKDELSYRYKNFTHKFELDKCHTDSLDVEFNTLGVDTFFMYLKNPYRCYYNFIYVE